MEKDFVQFCADAGSEYCPCHLAYSGDCIKCSMIQGNCTCDCDWQGVCIYNLLQHNKLSPVDERKEYICEVIQREEIRKNIYLLKIKLDHKLAQYLNEPGSYIFLKDKDKENPIYNAPISVMDIDTKNNILEVIVCSIGIKTRPLVSAEEVYVRGPYFNGIFGLKEIKSNKDNNCIVVINGLSQVNSINVIRRLKKNKNNVKVFVNNQTELLKPIEERIKAMGVEIEYFDINNDKKVLYDYIKLNDVKFVYCACLVEFSKEILNIVDSVDKNIKLAISNNNLICCGEGICGACVVDLNGKRIKTCKTQIDGREYLKYSK